MANITFYRGVHCWEGAREMIWNRPFRMSVYVYNVGGLLIDNGPLLLAEESKPFFYAFPVEQAVLTHLHEDHSGMSSWLQENLRVPIYLHRGSIPEAGVEAHFADYRLKLWGKRKPFQALEMPERLFADKYCFEAIETPGHLNCHHVFYEKEQGWLFSGDLIVNIKPKSVFHEENMAQVIQSIRKVLLLDFDTVFCSHRGVLSDGRRLLEYKLAYLLDLQYKVGNLRKKGLTDHQIAKLLFPENTELGRVTKGDFSSYYVVSTL